jgi:hypothetical protein
MLFGAEEGGASNQMDESGREGPFVVVVMVTLTRHARGTLYVSNGAASDVNMRRIMTP